MTKPPEPARTGGNSTDCLTLDFQRRKVNLQELSRQAPAPPEVQKKLPPVPGRGPVQSQLPGMPAGPGKPPGAKAWPLDD